jgi:catechol 2,3-dioxygenase-like lactoylglutathione lyase family enzyme
MIQHVSIGVRDVATARKFYDAVLGALGYSCLRARDTWVGYGKDRIEFSAHVSEMPVADDPKSGLHFCFIAPTRAAVEGFHAAALANGGRDNGRPAVRVGYAPNYFAAFAVDPDGYRIEAYCGEEK